MSKDKKVPNPVPIEIKAPTAGMVVSLITGAVASGATFCNIEFMKMYIPFPALLGGIFTAAVTVGTLVNKDDIIGYFFPGSEYDDPSYEEDYPLAGVNADIDG